MPHRRFPYLWFITKPVRRNTIPEKTDYNNINELNYLANTLINKLNTVHIFDIEDESDEEGAKETIVSIKEAVGRDPEKCGSNKDDESQSEFNSKTLKHQLTECELSSSL